MKTLFTLIITLLFNFQLLLACQCIGFSSFTESVRDRNYIAAIIEFEVISIQTNYMKVKILNQWKGAFSVGQEIRIWNLERKAMSSCGPPSLSVSSFPQNQRFITALMLKEGNSFDFPYDTAGQAYIPYFACGNSTLKVENDLVKGVTFGSSSYTSAGEVNTLEYDMLYRNFITRFSNVLLSIEEEVGIISDEITFYPNPAKDYIYIRSPGSGGIKIVGSGLAEVFSGVSNGQPVNISKLSPGVYTIEYILNDRKIVRKFVKE